jgi:perosamine synthetase
MSDATVTQPKQLTLPSDQDASGRSFGAEELRMLEDVLSRGTLFSPKGTYVKGFEKKYAELIGVKHAHACSSGTAAIHLAIAAIDPEPGDEIVTTSITDMGALTPILFQGAIPVFCDVDPKTCNVTAATIERCLSPKTKAIIVTHLFGNPCDMDPIMELARSRNIPVIEDCAQAFMSTYKGKPVGTIGDIGCFSLQQGKHITTGEGGIVVSNNDALARRMFLFIHKAWGYGDAKPDHYFLALNYRMSELQGAVALAQLGKLARLVEQRRTSAQMLTKALRDVPGIETPHIHPSATHTYWKYSVRVDPNLVPGGTVALGRVLGEKSIASAPRYIVKPAFACEIFQKHRTFGNSGYPFTLARPEVLKYDVQHFPGTREALEAVLVLPWNERYTEEHVEYIAASIRQAVGQLRGENR